MIMGMKTAENALNSQIENNQALVKEPASLLSANTENYLALAGCVLTHIIETRTLTYAEKALWLVADGLALINVKKNPGNARNIKISAASLGKKLNIEPSSILKLQKNLELKGYFYISRSTKNQRNKNIITPTLPENIFNELCLVPNRDNLNGHTFFNPHADSKRRFLDDMKLFIAINYHLLCFILKHKNLTYFSKILWLDIYVKSYKRGRNNGDVSGLSCTVSHKELAAQHGKTETQISQSLIKLENEKLVTRDRRFIECSENESNRRDKSLWEIKMLDVSEFLIERNEFMPNIKNSPMKYQKCHRDISKNAEHINRYTKTETLKIETDQENQFFNDLVLPSISSEETDTLEDLSNIFQHPSESDDEDEDSFEDSASKFLEQLKTSVISNPFHEDNTTQLDSSQTEQLSEPAPVSLTAREKMATGLKLSSYRKCKKLYLRNVILTQEKFDQIRERSNKPHFTNERITDIIIAIDEKEPNKEIKGEKAFINYMVKVVDNEREDDKVGEGESIAEIQRKKKEDLEYRIKNDVLTYTN